MNKQKTVLSKSNKNKISNSANLLMGEQNRLILKIEKNIF